MYDKKVADGFEVLEIAKGTWVEAIFAKEKPEMEKPRITYQSDLQKPDSDNYDNDDEDLPEIEDHYNDIDEDDEFDEDKLTEESYRTTFETNPEDLELADDEVLYPIVSTAQDKGLKNSLLFLSPLSFYLLKGVSIRVLINARPENRTAHPDKSAPVIDGNGIVVAHTPAAFLEVVIISIILSFHFVEEVVSRLELTGYLLLVIGV